MFSGLRTSSIWLPFTTHLPRNPNFKMQPPSPSSQMNQAPLHFTNPFVALQGVLMTAGPFHLFDLHVSSTFIFSFNLRPTPPFWPTSHPAYSPIQPKCK